MDGARCKGSAEGAMRVSEVERERRIRFMLGPERLLELEARVRLRRKEQPRRIRHH